MTNEMTNEEAKRVLEFDLDHTYNDESKEALRIAIKALETIPKYKDAYGKGWIDGAKASYEHLKMCEEEQETSGDLISRQAVNDLISKFIIEIHTEGGRDLNAHTNDVLRQILRNINSDEVLPSVNPQEPKYCDRNICISNEYNGISCDECEVTKSQEETGHWEWVQYDYNPKLGNWHCSECRSIVIECVNKKDKGGIPLYKYCPQCGARMESEEE